MPTVDAVALLAAWEAGSSEPPLKRALLLLAAGSPDRSENEWARAAIGARDARLLRLHEEWFGARLEATEICPCCGEQLEAAFNTRDIQGEHPGADDADEHRLTLSEYEIEYRLPTSLDLWEAGKQVEADPREALLLRCITAASRNGTAVDLRALPPSVTSGVVEAMADGDPMADVQVKLSCVPCGHSWSVALDIAGYLWGELDEWAERLLLEIHTLASAYGWREGEILALSQSRRRSYLDLLGA